MLADRIKEHSILTLEGVVKEGFAELELQM